MWLLWLFLALCALTLGLCALVLRLALGPFRCYDPTAYARNLRGSQAQYAPAILAAVEAARDIPLETLTLRAYDGAKLVADLYRADGPSRGTIVLAHGFRGGARGDFSCAIPLYHALGWDELLIDERAQGRSEGRRMGLGVLERHDVAAWARLMAARRPGAPIVLDGISMGAASVLMACALPLPAEVRGVVADCGFTSPDEQIAWLCTRLHLPRALFVPIFRALARPVLGYGLRDASTLDALAHSELPLLLLHGESDYFVPCEMSRRAFAAAAAPDKTLLTVPSAGHGMSFLVDNARCTEALRAFLSRIAPAG